MLVIRLMAASDADRLIEIFRSSVRNVAIRDYSFEQVLAWAPDEIDTQSFLDRCMAKPTYVAEIDGIIAGFSDRESDGHIDRLFVHAEYQKLGIGTALLQHVESEARKQEVPRLYSEVSITAKPCFERQGFTVIKQQTVESRGQSFVNYQMEKVLD